MRTLKEDMLIHRREKFAVEVKKSRSPEFDDEGELSLSITHNGYQWQSIGLLLCEARKVIAELENYLERMGAK